MIERGCARGGEAEFQLQLSADRDDGGCIDAEGEFEVQSGSGDALKSAEALDDGLGFRRDRVVRGEKADESEDGDGNGDEPSGGEIEVRRGKSHGIEWWWFHGGK